MNATAARQARDTAYLRADPAAAAVPVADSEEVPAGV
jgi:hypothetical protein